MKSLKVSTVLVVTFLVGALALAGGSVSCGGGRLMPKSTVSVGTSNAQTAFYASLMAVNKYRYPFEEVDATAGVIRTGQVSAKGGWFAFHIQVQATGEILIDPVTNLERATANGVFVPRGVVSRANNIAQQISKTITTKSDEQIVLEGEALHQQVIQGLAVVATPAPVVPGAAEAGTAVPAD